jgi:hypothetical protein
VVACEAPGDAPPLPEETPLAAANHTHLTSHADIEDFLERLAHASHRIELRSLGTSTEGREIPYLKVSTGDFGADREHRTMLLIYAQQHGNEPSGKEGTLELALELARGDHDDLLEGVDILLVPQVNPDGGEIHQRQNAEGVDLNRSHFILDGVEVVALRELFHRWEPEVAVDVHEYYPWSDAWLSEGWLRLWDLQIGLPTNLNTDPEIRRLAEDSFLPGAISALEDAGFTSHNYVVGSPDGLRWSTTNFNDGRQSLGLLHTLSFIYEGRREQEPAGRIAHRAEAQRTGLEHLIRFAAEEGALVRSTVRDARRRAEAGEITTHVLTMGRDYGDEPLEIPVEAVVEENGEWMVTDTVTAVIEEFRPQVTEGRTTTLPRAYLIPANEEGIIALLRGHHVEMETLDEGTELEVERLRIEGHTIEELENPTAIPDVARSLEHYTTQEGDVLVPTAQLRGVMVAAALEPESMHSLLDYEQFSHLDDVGEFPVLRVPR